MNLILLEPEEIDAAGRVVLQDRRCDHITAVLGLEPGDSVRVGIINGRIGAGTIESLTEKQVVLSVVADLAPPPRPGIDLILAMPRPIMLKRVLSQVAAFGIDRLYLVNANRVEKSFLQASLVTGGGYEEYLRLGLEQAVDTILPRVSVHQRFRPFVEDFLPGCFGEYRYFLVAHPEAVIRLDHALGGSMNGRVLLAIGPEGGWVDFEIACFKELGFIPVSMGPRIFRVETAVVALLGQLTLLTQQDKLECSN